MSSEVRYACFDAVRACAIVLIMVCHWSRGAGYPFVGDWCGIVGNSLFFILSGLLLGIGWHSKGCPRYGMTFLKRRCRRLFPAFWLVLLVYLVIMMLKGASLPIVRFIANLIGMSWFCKLEGAGYLWFVTAILIFYGEVVLLSRIKKIINRVGAVVSAWLSLLVVAILQYMLVRVNVHQAWYLSFVWSAGMAFVYAKEIVDWLLAKTFSFRVAGCASLLAFGGVLYALLVGGVCVNGAPMAYWFGIVVSMSCLAVIIAPNMSGVGVISDLSYELYLTHSMVLFFVPLKKFTDNMVVSFVLFAMISFLSAFILKNLAKAFVRILP